jgi:hypothetical protein
MVSVISAKWREYIELKESRAKTTATTTAAAPAQQQQPLPSSSSSSSSSSSTDGNEDTAAPSIASLCASASAETNETKKEASTPTTESTSKRARTTRGKRSNANEATINVTDSNDEQTAAEREAAANEAAIAAATAELEGEDIGGYSTRTRSARNATSKKQTRTSSITGKDKVKLGDDDVASSPATTIEHEKEDTPKPTKSRRRGTTNVDTEMDKDTAAAVAAAATTSTRSTKKRKRANDASYADSDAEFEAMIEEQCRQDDNIQNKKKQKEAAKKAAIAAGTYEPANRGCAKTKKNPLARRAVIKNSTDADEFEDDHHQGFCQECKAGGEIILCETCPKAYHLICLKPELEKAPDGDWYCPLCEKDGKAAAKRAWFDEQTAKALVDTDGIVHLDYCVSCKDGGELVCCETCPQSFHIDCLNPPLKKMPEFAWHCAKCTCPKPHVVKKILTWRWQDLAEKKSDEVDEEEVVKDVEGEEEADEEDDDMEEDEADETEDADDDEPKSKKGSKAKSGFLKIKFGAKKATSSKRKTNDDDEASGI